MACGCLLLSVSSYGPRMLFDTTTPVRDAVPKIATTVPSPFSLLNQDGVHASIMPVHGQESAKFARPQLAQRCHSLVEALMHANAHPVTHSDPANSA